MPTTMKEIAKYLGISPSTVSRALSNTGYVSQGLRAKIVQAAIDLDYQPNLLARSLRKQYTKIIGLIIPDLRNPHYTDVAQAIEGLLSAHDYQLLLSVSNEDPQSELSYLQAMQKQRVAGIIISTVGGNDEYMGHLVKQGIPVIAHSREVRAQGVDNVLAPNEEGAYAATKHLIDLGHRKIGIVCGPQELSTGRDRLRGYTRALSEFGIPLNPELVKISAFQRQFGALAAAELLELDSRPTAIFAAGGELVIGAMRTFSEKGVSVPQQMSISGFDDPDWFSYWEPPITTVAMDLDRLSQMTVDMLIERMANDTGADQSVYGSVPISFIVRSSTARPEEPSNADGA